VAYSIIATLSKTLHPFILFSWCPQIFSNYVLITMVATRGLLGANPWKAHLEPKHGAFLERSQSRDLKQEDSEAGWPLSREGVDGLEPCTGKYWLELARSAILECL